MCVALVGNAGEVELKRREAVTQADLDLWIVTEGGVSSHQGVSCANCEGSALCRSVEPQQKARSRMMYHEGSAR